MYSAALLFLAGRHFSFSESIHLRIRHFVTVTLICFGHLFNDFSPCRAAAPQTFSVAEPHGVCFPVDFRHGIRIDQQAP